jgi:hypothetical protein
MNRIVVFGIAMFFALVGIALVGGENKASAFFGHRCGGCSCNGCHGGGCHGGCHSRCHGGCHSRCHGCHSRCHGRCHGGCCNGGGCCGGYESKEAGPVQAPASPEKQAPAQAPAK